MKKLFSKPNLKNIGIALGILGILSAATYVWFNPKSSSDSILESKVDEAFAEYVSAYTSGTISVNSSIKIRFAQPATNDSLVGSEEIRDLLDISPKVSGTLKWIDNHTIEFTPKEWLERDQIYQIEFDLGQVFNTTKELSTLEFSFKTIKQDFDMEVGDIITSADNMNTVSLEGTLSTADIAQTAEVEQMVKAFQNDSELEITWIHSGETTHQFKIEKIIRGEKESQVQILLDGDQIDIDKTDKKEIKIPALGDFYVLRALPVIGTDQYIQVSFSDPIDPNQELSGLITTDKEVALKFIVENNFIKVYPDAKIIGAFQITLHEGIKNILGYKMKKEYNEELVFEQVKPSVRLVGDGVIVPASEGLIFPFEAVGLKACDITIIEIFENNVVQFFQTNNLKGDNQLKRVARPIFRKSLRLDQNKLLNINKWNRFTIDLADIITPTPGSIYQVEISFRQSQSAYSCGGVSHEDELTSIDESKWTAESYTDYSYWDYYEDDYNYEYDWSERDNPCHPTYYAQSERRVKRNILASNLGLIAKIGMNKEVFVACTDLNTTEPIAEANIQVFDFQQQIIAEGTTDSKGFLTLKTEIKPFLIKATKVNDINYLKVDDGSSLSLSNFNVGGVKIDKGLKGFIYGERDVWRPGDTLFLSFILEDKNEILPKKHPVIFELHNPDGKLIHKSVKQQNLNGFYTYQPVTKEEDMTGAWSLKVKIGNTSFSKSLKIETINPNRLKINLDFGKEYLSVLDNDLSGNLEVKWLHGGIAKNLKAEFELVLTKSRTSFEKYDDYTFEDQSRRFSPERLTLFEGKLDENGMAKIPAKINIDGDAPGVLNAHFKGKVYEQSGDFSVNQFTLPYYAYESFVGLRVPEGDHRGMLLTDQDQPIDIVCLSPSGNTTTTPVEVTVYKLEWKWWWDNSSNGSSNYIGTEYKTPIITKRATIHGGKGQVPVQVNHPSWGRYYIKVKDLSSGHTAGKVAYFDWPGWAGKAKRDLPDAATMLTFSSDKEEYQVGETMKLTIPGSGEGKALVSIENGSKVIEKHWVSLQKGENEFSVAISKEMTPNVFVHITAIQPHAQTINDHPIRMYGIIPIDVSDQSTHLAPVIDMPKELTPGGKVPITISEKDGKPMTFTLAVVDEGLLSLTNFKTPEPWPNFYQHEALGVNTWDIYKYVLGAYGGEVERILAIGGDGTIMQEEGEKSKRFKPVVKFFGPYHIDISEKKNIEFTMPNYIGAVRTMVVAGYDGAYGHAEKETPVRQSLMVQGTLPRVLSPNEKLKLPVNVFAYEDNMGDIEVTVTTRGPLRTIQKTQKISINRKSDKIINFDLETSSNIGQCKVLIEASSGKLKSKNEIDIEVRNPNPYNTKVFSKILSGNESITQPFEQLGMKGTNTYSIEVSSIPPINLASRLKYLVKYPHGCVEQTTSGAFPQLFLGDIMELDDRMKERMEANVTSGIERLRTMQLSNGGFGYWPSASQASDWGSSYAGHFLVSAKKKGFYVPSDLLNDWKSFQRKTARNWTNQGKYNSELQQAYRLYTLALAGSPEKGAMNRLKEQSLNKTSQYMLAAAYALTGRDDVAKNLIASAPSTLKNYREYGYTYGSNYRDEALLLLTLNAMKDPENGLTLVKTISERLNQKRWMSTQETAFSLLAISDYIAGQPTSSNVNFEYTVDGKAINIISEYSIFKQEFNENEIADLNVSISNKSNAPMFLNLVSTGQPLVDTRTSENKIIEMTVNYADKDGNELSPSSLPQNQDVMVSVEIKNTGLRGNLSELALSTIFPSGWEIQNSRMDVVADFYQTDIPDYQNYRDDRVLTYFDLLSGRTKTFTFLVNTSYLGEFTRPGFLCEAMYDNEVSAYYKGGTTKTTK